MVSPRPDARRAPVCKQSCSQQRSPRAPLAAGSARAVRGAAPSLALPLSAAMEAFCEVDDQDHDDAVLYYRKHTKHVLGFSKALSQTRWTNNFCHGNIIGCFSPETPFPNCKRLFILRCNSFLVPCKLPCATTVYTVSQAIPAPFLYLQIIQAFEYCGK